ELIPGFLEGRKKDIETIRNSLETGNFESIQLLGHSMKGNGSGYGFDEISTIGKNIELAAKEKNINEIKQCLLDLSAYLDNIDIIFE
ncbi:Hpt domain-containing protein, partial [bacterium]|nr:Hpt domain-containing protein [bacterium]